MHTTNSQYSHCTNYFGSMPFSLRSYYYGVCVWSMRSVCVVANGSAFQHKYAILNFQFRSESNRPYPVAARVYLLPYHLFFMFLSLFRCYSFHFVLLFETEQEQIKKKKLHVLTTNRQKRMFMFQTAREHNK